MSNIVDLTNDGSVAAVVSTLVELNKEVTAQGVTLTPAQRQAALKLRAGSEQVIPAVIDLATRYNVVVPNYTLAQMQSDLALLVRLEPFATASATLTRACLDDQLATGSKVWGAAIAIYSSLKILAGQSPELAHELPFLQAFFAPKKAKTSSAAGNGAATTGTSTAISGTSATGTSGAGLAPNGSASTAVANGGSASTPVVVHSQHLVARRGDRRTAIRAHSRERRVVPAA